jgi:hypothetical protein
VLEELPLFRGKYIVTGGCLLIVEEERIFEKVSNIKMKELPKRKAKIDIEYAV